MNYKNERAATPAAARPIEKFNSSILSGRVSEQDLNAGLYGVDVTVALRVGGAHVGIAVAETSDNILVEVVVECHRRIVGDAAMYAAATLVGIGVVVAEHHLERTLAGSGESGVAMRVAVVRSDKNAAEQAVDTLRAI